jgi:hypothetical protein
MSYSVFGLGDRWLVLPDCGNESVIVFPVPQHFISHTWSVYVIVTNKDSHHGLHFLLPNFVFVLR